MYGFISALSLQLGLVRFDLIGWLADLVVAAFNLDEKEDEEAMTIRHADDATTRRPTNTHLGVERNNAQAGQV